MPLLLMVMVQCSETELDPYINANGIIPMLTRINPKPLEALHLKMPTKAQSTMDYEK